MTIPADTAKQLARILGPTLTRVAAEVAREVQGARTADELLHVLCPTWAPWVTQLVREDIVEAARRMRPDLFMREAESERSDGPTESLAVLPKAANELRVSL
jgi:hypothetical protein